MSSNLFEDTEARRVARSTFDRPVVLRAGAGTGKTAALVARVISWITGEGWARSIETLGPEANASLVAARTLQRVVAITFTEAAAAEMAQRISEALHALGNGDAVTGIDLDELSSDAPTRAKALLPAVDQLEVRTIHAWCRNILVQYPLEARLHPDFDVDASGDQIAAIVRDQVELQLADFLSGESAPVLLDLMARGITPGDIEAGVQKLVDESVQFDIETDKSFKNNEMDAFWLRSRDAITTVISWVDGVFEGVRAPNGVALAVGLEGFRDALNPGAGVGDVQAALDEYLPEKLRAHLLKAWVNGKGGKGESGALEPIAERLSSDALIVSNSLRCIAGLDPEGFELARLVVGPMVEAVQAEMVRKGLMGFTGLLVRAARLLKNTSVAGSVRSRIDQLLVDEFQDTDPLQCDIVRAIALQGDRAHRPGLFLVGDPKQSIYGWRSADLRAYEGFVAEVVAEGGVEHGLVQNFRSTSQVLDEVDKLMAGLLVARPGIQPAHESLIAARGSGPDVPALEAWVSWAWSDGEYSQPTNADAARGVEAKGLAADIVRLRDDGVVLSDIGVLFRSTTQLQIYQWALRDAGIPYEVTRDRNYFKRREIVEAAAMVRAVLDPMDTLALVSFLRSGMVCVPDAALLPLWTAGFPSAWASIEADGPEACLRAVDAAAAQAATIEADVSGLAEVRAWSVQLAAVVQRVSKLRCSVRALPADVWVNRLRSAFLPDVLGSVAYQGAYRVANLEQFFRLLCGQLEDQGGDLQAVLRGLRDAIGKQREAEESRPSGADAAVQLMTIHKSKGLAFTHTYIVDLHHRFRPASVATGTAVDGKFGIQLLGLWPPGFDRSWTRARVVEEAERVRLLYVAMTRARDRLVLMGAWPVELNGLVRPKMILDLFGERVPALPDPQVLAERLSPLEDETDVAGVRWVFPGKLGREAISSQMDDGGMKTVGVRATVSAATAAAELHASRPWSLGPSAAGHSEPAVVGGGSIAREEAMIVGTAIHRLLEWVAGGLVDVSEASLQQAIKETCGNTSLSPKASERANDLLESLQRGRLVQRLKDVEVLGTEVPMLMSSGDGGPVGAWAGSIDLVYRCPETQCIVVADFKTDRVGGRSLNAVAQHHASQGEIYTEAVQKALQLDAPPAFEVWLVEVDQYVTVTASLGD